MLRRIQVIAHGDSRPTIHFAGKSVVCNALQAIVSNPICGGDENVTAGVRAIGEIDAD